MTKREIPLKNYIILFVISCITVGLLFYLVSLYKSSENYINSNSLLSEFLSEIKYDEIENYIIDNPEAIMYIAANDDDHREFEKSFKKLLIDNGIKNEIIYLTVDESIINKLKDKHFNDNLKKKNVNIYSVPNLVVFEDGKIIDVLYKAAAKAKTSDFEKLLKDYGIINND